MENQDLYYEAAQEIPRFLGRLNLEIEDVFPFPDTTPPILCLHTYQEVWWYMGIIDPEGTSLYEKYYEPLTQKEALFSLQLYALDRTIPRQPHKNKTFFINFTFCSHDRVDLRIGKNNLLPNGANEMFKLICGEFAPLNMPYDETDTMLRRLYNLLLKDRNFFESWFDDYFPSIDRILAKNGIWTSTSS